VRRGDEETRTGRGGSEDKAILSEAKTGSARRTGDERQKKSKRGGSTGDAGDPRCKAGRATPPLSGTALKGVIHKVGSVWLKGRGGQLGNCHVVKSQRKKKCHCTKDWRVALSNLREPRVTRGNMKNRGKILEPGNEECQRGGTLAHYYRYNGEKEVLTAIKNGRRDGKLTDVPISTGGGRRRIRKTLLNLVKKNGETKIGRKD